MCFFLTGLFVPKLLGCCFVEQMKKKTLPKNPWPIKSGKRLFEDPQNNTPAKDSFIQPYIGGCNDSNWLTQIWTELTYPQASKILQIPGEWVLLKKTYSKRTHKVFGCLGYMKKFCFLSRIRIHPKTFKDRETGCRYNQKNLYKLLKLHSPSNMEILMSICQDHVQFKILLKKKHLLFLDLLVLC